MVTGSKRPQLESRTSPPASALTVGFGAYLPLPSTVLSGLQDGIQTPGVSDPYPECAGQEQGKEEVPVPKASFHEDSRCCDLFRSCAPIRYDRATATQASSRLNQHIFHLPDGPEQEERDRQMRMAMEAALSEVEEQVRRRVHNTATVTSASAVVAGQKVGAPADANRDNANRWADKAKSRIQFGYDADAEAEKWWAEHGQKTIGVLARM
ncbi:hypothetical protein L210DRAFT_3643173 [Boletus edulis BED1]|uniref:Uncharacterized protein n=1 Tax=Boletus edulis BED1 TaxID=1328754 RepID=A0AAD4GHG3_BOLED|nr:hypothetical protein L210DRAFT_3643173 [Boletus edulis BED1]